MKTTKPEWTATNDKGEKLFYFRELGWISAETGFVTPDAPAVVVVQPDDATHIQIHKGRVNFLRVCDVLPVGFEFSMWNEGGWLYVGGGLSGQVIRLEDAQEETPVPNSVGNPWLKHDGKGAPKTIWCKPRRVEVQLFNGNCHKGDAGDFRWVWPNNVNVPRNDSVVRWRYA